MESIHGIRNRKFTQILVNIQQSILKEGTGLLDRVELLGVQLDGSVATLEHPILEHIRISALAVRGYFGEG